MEGAWGEGTKHQKPPDSEGTTKWIIENQTPHCPINEGHPTIDKGTVWQPGSLLNNEPRGQRTKRRTGDRMNSKPKDQVTRGPKDQETKGLGDLLRIFMLDNVLDSC